MKKIREQFRCSFLFEYFVVRKKTKKSRNNLHFFLLFRYIVLNKKRQKSKKNLCWFLSWLNIVMISFIKDKFLRCRHLFLRIWLWTMTCLLIKFRHEEDFWFSVFNFWRMIVCENHFFKNESMLKTMLRVFEKRIIRISRLKSISWIVFSFSFRREAQNENVCVFLIELFCVFNLIVFYFRFNYSFFFLIVSDT
jgi:hypothetical protein